MIIFVILVISLIFMTFLGYITHKLFHNPISGIFFRSHTDHHNKQYPPNDMVSDKYRSSGSNNTTYYFALIFSPLIFGNIALTILGIIPTILGIGIFLEMGLVSWLNIFIHDTLHITNGFWHKFKFFKRLQQLHFVHHLDQSKNFGIFSFTIDKILGTYKE